MNQRQRNKTLKRFCRLYAVKPEYFEVQKKRRYNEVLTSLRRQLDGLMDYYYGKYCR